MTTLLDPRVAFETISGGYDIPEGNVVYLVDTDLLQRFAFIGITLFKDDPNATATSGCSAESYNWDGKQDVAEYLASVEAQIGFPFPEGKKESIVTQLADFYEYIKSGTFLELDVADARIDLDPMSYSTDELIESEQTYEDEADDGDDDYDESTCDACGGHISSGLTGALYEANSKYDAVVTYYGRESCDEAVSVVAHPVEGRSKILDDLSIYRGMYSAVAGFCVALGLFK